MFVRFILVGLWSLICVIFITYSPDDGYLCCFNFFLPAAINASNHSNFCMPPFFLFVKWESEHFPVYRMPLSPVIASYRRRSDSHWGFLGLKPILITVSYVVKVLISSKDFHQCGITSSLLKSTFCSSSKPTCSFCLSFK